MGQQLRRLDDFPARALYCVMYIQGIPRANEMEETQSVCGKEGPGNRQPGNPQAAPLIQRLRGDGGNTMMGLAFGKRGQMCSEPPMGVTMVEGSDEQAPVIRGEDQI